MSGITPQQRTRNLLTEQGWLVGSVERRKKFPDRKKGECRACGHQPMIEISSDLWEVFDLVGCHPEGRKVWMADQWGHGGSDVVFPNIIFVQTTSRANHSTRRNKILASMEAKLVLLSGAQILLQSWGQDKDSRHWKNFDEWIELKDYNQAPHYPSTVRELVEIKRKAKKPDLPPGATLPLSEDLGKEAF